MHRPHIVIIGAGFGGVYVAKHLAASVKSGEIDVTIVNKTNNFLFTPLLHEVATGGLSPRIVAESLREIFVHTGVRIVQGSVDAVNAEARTVVVKQDGASTSLSYDYLVVATGAETNYYGISGAQEFALPLKSIADATRIRSRVIDSFERAVLAEDPAERSRLLSFVVVGGGATGVETTAELAELVGGMVERYYGATNCRADDPRHCEPEEPSITLVNASHDILEQFKPVLRAKARARLEHKGVRMRMDAAVTQVTKEGISIAPAGKTEPVEAIPASVVVWTAGVKAMLPHFEGGTPAVERGRLKVDDRLRIEGSDRIFALGDAASMPKPLPMLAQVAQAQAATVADNVTRAMRGAELKRFVYRSKGSMVSVGEWFAIGDVFFMTTSGWFTWWMWRTVYLSKFASWKKRTRIAIEWALETLFPRDITKIS